MKRGFRVLALSEDHGLERGVPRHPSQPSSPEKWQSREDRPERQSKAGSPSVQGTSSGDLSNIALLKSFSGMGVLTPMVLFLELGDVSRFRQRDRLSAYAALSPSQYSSGEKVPL